MGLTAALGIGSSIVGGIMGHSGEKKRRQALYAGRDAGNKAWDKSNASINAMYQPYQDWGEAAGDRLDRASEGDYSAFKKSLGYDFRKSEGMRDVGNHFSAAGGGGNAMKALTEWNQNMASNEYGAWWDRQSGVADRGMNANAGVANSEMNTASGKSNNNMRAAGAVGESHVNDANMITNSMNAGVGNYLYGESLGLGKKKPKPGSGNVYTGKDMNPDEWY